MDAQVKFESKVLTLVEPFLGFNGRAEWFGGTLFVEGVTPLEANDVLIMLRRLDPKIQVSRFGNQNYTFAYDFVV